MGIFNFFMPDTPLTSFQSGQEAAKAVLRQQLSIAMTSPNRSSPYRQIGDWVNMIRLSNDIILSKVVDRSTSPNRSVNDHTRIAYRGSLKKIRMIDLITHNQLQFSVGMPVYDIIQSDDVYYMPQNFSGIHQHIGDDECLISKKVNSPSNYFLQFNIDTSKGCCCQRTLEPFLLTENQGNFPIPTFPKILHIDPIYFHC
jgi:hypothetical protein